MIDVTKIGVRVEKTATGYTLTDHVGGVYETRPLNDGRVLSLACVREGRFPTFTRKDKVVDRGGILCLVGR